MNAEVRRRRVCFSASLHLCVQQYIFMKKTRRTFIKKSGLALGASALWLYGCGPIDASGQAENAEVVEEPTAKELFFKISLAQWSLHRTIRDKKELDNLDFAATAKNVYGIGAVEYVNQFFADKANDQAYLTEMKKRATDNGVESVLIMVDGEGDMAATNAKTLRKSIENHYKWVDAAALLGCHSIRVNARSDSPDMAEAAKAAVDGLSKLAEYGQQAGINVIVENHGGYSSNGNWLNGVMAAINKSNCGTLPDFGNFCIRHEAGKCAEEYDRYTGVRELMPYAKGVSAKTHDFDEKGNEMHTDFRKMLKIVKDAGYTGYIGIEYEGGKFSEDEGIKRTKALLERVGAEI